MDQVDLCARLVFDHEHVTRVVAAHYAAVESICVEDEPAAHGARHVDKRVRAESADYSRLRKA